MFSLKSIAALIEELGTESSVGPVGLGWEIQQNPEEFALFVEFCISAGVQTVLELGTGRSGGLARFMAEKLGWSVTSVDLYRPDPGSDLVEFIQASTAAAYPFLCHRQFDLVFIDADHLYAAVRRDHLLYAHLGKIVAFHDIAPDRVCCPDTIQYWTEIAYHGDGLKPDHYEAIAPTQNAGIGWYVNHQPTIKQWSLKDWSQPLPEAVPDITVVTGTYNRLPFLKEMIESARAAVERGLKLDFVIVDGGSNDGTQAWAKWQADITLIEHGQLRGAIRAFCDGAKAARGHYVVMANDDIVFLPGSLSAAWMRLESEPRAGAVAFAFEDNTHPGVFVLNYQQVIHDGKKHDTAYAQVGMYPRWLGDAVGWWGADDPDFGARTYGGDNYLSSRIMEAGYWIDIDDGARYSDKLVPDALREINNHAELIGGRHPDTICWLQRFNGGLPVFKSAPLESGYKAPLKILYAPIYADDSPILQQQRTGWLESLQKIATVIELDYVNLGKRAGAAAVRSTLLKLVREFKPDILLTQVHTPDYLTSLTLAEARATRPEMIVVNWNGDESRERISDPAALSYMRRVDLQLVVSGHLFAPLIENGIRVDWGLDSFQPVISSGVVRTHDVVYLGNCYPLFGQPSPRLEMERCIREMGVNAGFYGNGWTKSDGENMRDYSQQHAIYESARITLVDNLYPDAYGYVSDRLYNALAFGQFVLWKPCEGADLLLGLKEGVHYIGWSDFDDLIGKLRYWLDPARDKSRLEIGAAGRRWVHSYHSYDARTRAMLDALRRLTI